MEIVPFPRIKLEYFKEDANPAIKLFGRRFEKEQTAIEYLAEFLLVFSNPKVIVDTESKPVSEMTWEFGFPDNDTLKRLASENLKLRYAAPARLVLKLFAFLGSSKLETRHLCHQKHFQAILGELKSQINTSGNILKDDILGLIEQVLLGFIGIAQNRTWCTHLFLPVSKALIAGESIWRRKEAQKNPDLTWHASIEKFHNYYDFSKHRFMARGGEVLYLQLCNLFSRENTLEFANFLKKMGYTKTPEDLKAGVEEGLKALLASVSSLEKLVQWIEEADPDTTDKTNKNMVTCAWCPDETWPEAYLFAYELVNICEALIDPLEKLEMLKCCCVFQVFRTMCAQSVRYGGAAPANKTVHGNTFNFAWIVTDRNTRNKPMKDASKANLVKIQKLIHGALRTREPSPREIDNKLSGYKEADDQVQGIFLKLGKKIGFVAPSTGPGARFVVTEDILRFLVLALVPPGKRMTLDSFRETLYKHYSIGITGWELDRAVHWTYPGQSFVIRNKDDNWLEEKLRATGFLLPLSDAVSLVRNPFG